MDSYKSYYYELKTDEFIEGRATFVTQYSLRRLSGTIVIGGILFILGLFGVLCFGHTGPVPLATFFSVGYAGIVWVFLSYRRYCKVIKAGPAGKALLHEYRLAVPVYIGENDNYVLYARDSGRSCTSLICPVLTADGMVMEPEIRRSQVYRYMTRQVRTARFRCYPEPEKSSYLLALSELLYDQATAGNHSFFQDDIPFQSFRPYE